MKKLISNTTLKKSLFAFILLLLFMPIIQESFEIFKLKPLHGSFSKNEPPEFSKDTWFEGNYQVDKQDYIDQNIGFKSLFVRTYNQINYSLFNKARAKGVIVGKNNYLFEENYIKAYLGSDFIGEEEIEKKVKKLKEIQQILKNKGKEIVVVFAPGKGSYYPEFIPDEFNPSLRKTSNYEVYKQKIKKENIRFLDFNSWFINMKSNSRFPLFPKTGIHWSKYGENLAADSMIKYINTFNTINKIPELIIGPVEPSDTVRSSDDDIEKGMNLLFNIEDLKMGYTGLSFTKNENENPLKVLMISDSYFWGMFNSGVSKHSFNSGQFWYYNKQIYPDSYKTPLKVEEIDIVESVEKNDIIILMSTDANLYKFAFGFIEQLSNGYEDKGEDPNSETVKKEKRIAHYIHSIKETPEWFKSVKEEAIKTSKTLDEVLRKHAEYMVWQENNK